MATHLEIDRAPAHWMQIGFYSTAILFNLCLVAQVLTVGIAYFYDSTWWAIHVWLVRGYGGLSLILLAGSLIVPFSQRIRYLTASLPILLALQFFSIHFKSPFHLDILHPLIGFTLLSVSSTLVHRTRQNLSINPQSHSV